MLDWLATLGIEIWHWFGVEDHQDRITAIAAAFGMLVAVLGAFSTALWWIITRRRKQDDPPRPGPVPPLVDPSNGPVITLTLKDYEQRLADRAAEVRREMETASEEKMAVLRAELAELERQRAEPEEALAALQTRIADLEARLSREANTLDPEKLASARAALEKGDFSLADDLFADIEARTELEVQQAARAAFGRGEVAEAEIRWADAAAHYAKAARLDPKFDTLFAAREYSWRSGDYATALRFGEDLLAWSREQGTQ